LLRAMTSFKRTKSADIDTTFGSTLAITWKPEVKSS
jgi:hypothetical protein